VKNEPPQTHTRTIRLVTPIDLNWEPDLWGRVRRQVQSARASSSPALTISNPRDLALQAEVAFDYFSLRELDERTPRGGRHDRNVPAFAGTDAKSPQGRLVSDLDVSQA